MPGNPARSDANPLPLPARRAQNRDMPIPDQLRQRGDQRVTASQLVRNFGLWQERAARGPVYVLHRGRPRLVLTSIDLMDALCAPHVAPQADDSALATLLDADGSIALILDREGDILLASAAARARFGETLRRGARPGALARTGGELLDAAAARVIASGIAETIEIMPDAFPSRRLRCRLSPFPDGCLLRATDMTAEQALAAAQARARAVHAAGESAGAIAVRLSLRGYVVAPGAALAALTGVSREALATARFVSLLAVASRVAVGEAIEAVAGDGIARRVDAECLVDGATAISVALGLAAAAIDGRIEELVATIVRRIA